MHKASVQCKKMFIIQHPSVMLKLKRLKAAKRRTGRKELFSGTALVLLLLCTSWQGIFNVPID